MMPTTCQSGELPQGLEVSASCVTGRPKFNSRNTSDRLREGAGLYLPAQLQKSVGISKHKVSAFKELGLDDMGPSATQLQQC